MSVPDKYFYTIGDVSRITATKPHILRYWESQFRLLRPARRYSGHRKYTQQDLDLINRIRHLIIDKKYTLAGAKKEIARHLNLKPKSADAKPTIGPTTPLTTLRDIKKEVDECLHILELETKQQDLALAP